MILAIILIALILLIAVYNIEMASLFLSLIALLITLLNRREIKKLSQKEVTKRE